MSDEIDRAFFAEADFQLACLANSLVQDEGPGPEWIEGQPCCRRCGCPIPEARVKTLPHTAWCVSCAEEVEHEGGYRF